MRWIDDIKGTTLWADDGSYVGMLNSIWFKPKRHVWGWFWAGEFRPAWVFDADLDDARCMVEQLIVEAE